MILFKPNGQLNVATDPTDLPQEGQNGNISSGAMTRCKNLRLDQSGVAKTRDGSSKVNSTALADSTIYLVVEHGGDRYVFAGHEEPWAVTHAWEDSTDYFSEEGYQFTVNDTPNGTDDVFTWEGIGYGSQ